MRSLCWLCCGMLCAPCAALADEFFTARIQPLFASKCAGCHGEGAAKIKGGFDMRSREGLLAGGESGTPALVPGDPEGSPLFVAVTWDDPDLEMPPKANDRLDAQQIADLRRWIEAGAPWPAAAGAPPPHARPQRQLAPGAWSPPDERGQVRIGTSGGTDPAWTARRYNPGDLWAFQPLPRPLAPPRGDTHPIDAFVDAGLAQRGLPPAPRAARHDLVRRLTFTLTGLPPTPAQLARPPAELVDELLASPHYGERMAQHWLDVARYADSNGFSRDDPRPDAHTYRSYVIESFNSDKPFDRFVREQIAGDELGLAGQEALAFLWMGPWEITAMTSAAVARQMWLDDVVNSVGVTFLGQELRCAKCHDHKFDPIPTRDYYALQAVFASTRHHVKEGTFRIAQRDPQPISILAGGSLASPTDEVAPGLLSALPLSASTAVPRAAEGRRAALANWVASPDNPLTARVIVNRVWAWHFGRGLVATPNGFGAAGAKPSHPELLDWMTAWFIDNGWSIKELHRLILTSAAFQRDTAHPQRDELETADPDGALLAVFRPRRLSAEEVRDSMLAASGELRRRVGGASFRAAINWEVAFQPRLAMGKILPPWEPDPRRSERHRRSLYAMRMRNLGHPLMEVLNRPPTELSCGRRDETTVVTQAFSLFNGEFANARALALAQRAAGAGGDLPAQVQRVFGYAYGRAPRDTELATALSHVAAFADHHRRHPPQPRPLPTEVQLSNVIEKTGEPELKTFPLDVLRDYERDLQPWEVDARTRALADLCLVLLNSSEFLYVY